MLKEDINRNIVYPSLFFNPIVLNEEITSGVEIIEIKDEEAETHAISDKSAENSWFTKYYNSKNDYHVNKSIGQRRCIKHEQKYDTNCAYSGNAPDQACTEFYGIDCRGDQNNSNTHTLPTIISNEVSSDTSSVDIEVIQSESSLTDSYDSHKMYEDYARKTPISYFDKNTQYFQENGNFLNIPSHESTSCSSYTDDEHEKEFITIRRIATPNPIYITRLNLPSSPTLPTVTEVTEPNKTLEITESNCKLYLKSNSWINSDHTFNSNQNIQKLSSLSERERRRKRLKEIQERRTERLELEESIQINLNNEEVMQNSKNSIINANDKNITSVEESRIIELSVVNKLENERSLPKSAETNSNTMEEIEGNWVVNDNEKDNGEAIEVFDCDLDYSRDKEINSTHKSSPANIASLHLSFNTDVDEERKSCLKRLLQCVTCCK